MKLETAKRKIRKLLIEAWGDVDQDGEDSNIVAVYIDIKKILEQLIETIKEDSK